MPASWLDVPLELSLEARGLWLWGGLLVAAAAVAQVWVSALRSRLSMSRWLRALFATSRMLLLLLLAAALAQVVLTRYEKRLEVALLLDASASIPDDQLQRAAEFVRQAWQSKGEAGARRVVFAESPTVLEGSDPATPIERPEREMSTDIARAVHSTIDLLPADSTRRIVVLSDGNQTRGDLLAEARSAATRAVELYSVPLKTLGLVDAYVESLSLPRSARPGERVNVRVKVVSNFSGPAEAALSAGGRTQRSQVELHVGENWVEFAFDAGNAGDQGVVGQVRSELDQVPDNDKLAGTLRVVSRPRALLLTEDLAADAPLLAALEAEGLNLEVQESGALPGGGLGPYDLLVFSSLSFERMGEREVGRIDSYLRETGGGLLLLAGEASQGLGEEQEHPLERLLPVRFKLKKKTEPNPIELVLLIDKSASMARQNKFGLALAAVERLIDSLPERSRVSVILFDDVPYVLFGLTDVKERERMHEQLYRLGTDGGTSIYPALRRAYAELKGSEARVKHVILLTDGISTTRFEHNGDLVEALARKEITVSAVAVGRESDRDHLRTIAQHGKGRFYYIEDPNSIPDILLEETKTVTRTNVVEDKFTPELLHAGEMLAGLKLEPLPELTGYNSADARPTSETYLLAREREPLLARWSVGLGKVTVLCADLRGEWSARWLEWDKYPALVGRLARHTMRDRNLQNFEVGAELGGERVRVRVDATDAYGNFLNDLPLELSVTRPDLSTAQMSLTQDRPGGYSGDFPLSEYGGYTLSVRPRSGVLRSEGVGRVQLEPPGEFVRTEPDLALLRAAAEVGGGRFDPAPAEVFAEPRQRHPRSQPLWTYFMYAAFAVVLLGTLLRRI